MATTAAPKATPDLISEAMRQAVVVGSALASHVVEAFGADRLLSLSPADLGARIGSLSAERVEQVIAATRHKIAARAETVLRLHASPQRLEALAEVSEGAFAPSATATSILPDAWRSEGAQELPAGGVCEDWPAALQTSWRLGCHP